MNLLATALVMGILFLPGSTAGATTTAITGASQNTASSTDDPSPRKVAEAKAEVTRTYQVKLTAYNAVPSQTDSDPSVTASGAASNSEVIAARSMDLAGKLPFGTVVRVTRTANDTPGCNFHKVEPYIGYRVIADSMNARWTNRVDVELSTADKVKVEGKSLSAAYALGLCGNVKIDVVGYIPVSRIPDTQEELARLFTPTELALR